MRPPRIIVTMPLAARLGGAEHMLWTFLRRVDRRRIEPLVVFLDDGPLLEEVAGLGIETVLVEAGRLRDLGRLAATTRSLRRLLREQRPDLVINWTAKSQLYGGIAATAAGMGDRVVWWQHGIPDGHWMDRLATVIPARAVGCSSQAAAETQARLRPRRRTFVVHPGIDDPRASSVNALRHGLAIPAGMPVVGIVGRLQPWKGQHLVLRASAELKRRGHPTHTLVVGGDAHDLSPEYGPRLERLVDDLDLRPHVTFTGQVPDPAPYLALMDVLVNASDLEPFGIVLLEGMAHEVPVVAVASGGPKEIIEHGRSGLLVDSADELEIADAVERLLADDELRRTIAAGGRRRFESAFSAERMVDDLQSQLEALVASRRPG